MAKGGIDLDDWSGAKAVRELHETVKKIEESNIRLQRWMFAVTVMSFIVGAIALWPIVKDWVR
jgi:hypothetical protein